MDDKSVEDIKGMLGKGQPEVFLDNLTQAAVYAFGGPRQYAVMLRHEFEMAQPGSVARQHILKQISDLVSRFAAIHKDAREDMSEFTQEELLQTLDALKNDAAAASESKEESREAEGPD